MSDSPILRTADSLGEGFAYFAWHRMVFPWSDCEGINDKTPGCGLDGCMREWRPRG